LSSAAAQATSTTTAALFDFDLHPNFTVLEIDGVPVVAADLTTGEALLDIFEVRIPAIKRITENQAAEIVLLKENVHTATSALALSESATADALVSRDAWREAAKISETSLFEDIFFAKELWFVAGLGLGVGITAWLVGGN